MVIDKKTLRNVFLGVGGCIVLYWMLHETDRLKLVLKFFIEILSPFAVGAAFAFIINVPMRFIEGKLAFLKNGTLKRLVSILVTFVLIVLVVFVVVQLIIPQIVSTIESLISKLPGFINEVMVQVQEFLKKNPELMEWIHANTDFENFDWTGLAQRIVSLVGDSVSTIMSSAFSAIGSLSDAIMDLVISFVFGIYCLFRKEILARQGRRLLYSFLPEKVCDISIRILRLTNSTFSNFISGQCLEAIILGCMFAVTMLIFGMPYIPLISVLISVTALVPIVGAFVGCILGAFFILVDDPMLAIWFVVMFLVLQQIEGNMIYPRVVGSSIGLPGMWVLLAVAFGGETMGVAGMLVMVPLASVIYTLLREITNERLMRRGIDESKLQDHPPEARSRLAGKTKSHIKILPVKNGKENHPEGDKTE